MRGVGPGKWPASVLVLNGASLLALDGAHARSMDSPLPEKPAGNPEQAALNLVAPDSSEQLSISTRPLFGDPGANDPRGTEPVAGSFAMMATALPKPEFAIAVKRRTPTTIDFEAPERGISARLIFASGNDVVRPGQHLLGGALTAANSWRRDVGLTLAVPQPDTVGFAVNAGAYSGRRPILGGDGIRHGVGELSRWQECRSWDFGVKFDLPDSGLHYSGGISRSQFSFQRATRNDNRDRLLSGKPRWRPGGSQWSRIDLGLWKNDSGEASAYVFYGTQDADFRNYRGGYDSPLILDGSTFEAGGELRYRGSRILWKTSRTEGSDLGLTENSVRVMTGPADLKIENGSWSFRDSLVPDWRLRDDYWKGNVRLSLKSILGGGFGKGILPGEATFRFDSTRSTSSGAISPADKERRKFGFGLSWTGKSSLTEVALSRVATDRPASVAGGPSREQSLAVDVNGYISGKSWEVSYYGSVGSQNSPFSADRNISGGVEFSLTGKNRPKLSVGVDYNRFDLRSYQLGIRDMEFSVNAKLDLSQYLPPTRTGQKPYLIVKAYGDWTKSRVTGEREDNRLDPTVMLVFGTKF